MVVEKTPLSHMVNYILQAKQRRIRDRYGDQDEDERQLKLTILGVSLFGNTAHLY